jgi:dihydrofolate reductase
MRVSIIVAVSDNGVIGHEGDLPWQLSRDLKRFKALTMGHHLLMGRKTFDSIGTALPGRTTVVISRGLPQLPPEVRLAHSHTKSTGDTFFPLWQESEWREVSREEHPTDDRNAHPHSFLVYDRKST